MSREGAEEEDEEDETVFAAIVGYRYFFQSVLWGSRQRCSVTIVQIPQASIALPCCARLDPELDRMGIEGLRVFLERCGDHPQRRPRLLLHPTQHLGLGLGSQESI